MTDTYQLTKPQRKHIHQTSNRSLDHRLFLTRVRPNQIAGEVLPGPPHDQFPVLDFTRRDSDAVPLPMFSNYCCSITLPFMLMPV
jgi:hypothetical protein